MSKQLLYSIIVTVVVGLVQPGLGNVLDPNLVGWWRFDEGSGTVAADSSGNDLHGTLVNDPLWREDGPRDGCLFFDGADAYVWVAQQDALNPSDGSFTMLFWGFVEAAAGTSGSTNWDLAVAKRDTASIGYYIGADRNQGGGDETGYRFMLGDNGANRKDTPFVTVPLGEWVFVASVLDRAQNTQKISVDGGQTWESTTPPAGPIEPVQDLGIGWDIGSNNFWFHGKIDDVAFFNRALSNGQINLIMQEGMTPALAKDAYPKDGATDVPFDALLSWSPGLYASTHDVYFGTSAADVEAATKTDPLGVLVSPDQSASVYDPGPLTLGQTYYWRVDEVNAPSEPGTFKGEIWSFTVEPVAYAVEGVTVTYSGISLPGSGPENTINGSGLNDDDQHSMELEDMWLSLPGAGPDQLVYEFDRPYSLYEMWVWNSNIEGEPAIGFSLKDVTVEYSLDGTDWILLGEEEFAQGAGADTYTANTTVPFDGVIAQYVRLTINSSWISPMQHGLSEVRFLYTPLRARQPDPASEANDLPPELILSWRPGRHAAQHDVYMDTDEQAVIDGTAPVVSVTEAAFDPGMLDLGQTYYWRVDEVNEADAIGVWEGDLWSFSTQEFLVVDDFESYTDYSPNRIFQTWIDGWGFSEDDFFPDGHDGNGTGAQVGNMDPPWAEQTIVYTGNQSMPLTYNNVAPPFYSETQRSFDEPQNWTLYGAGTLTVHFRGALDNTGHLYAKINGVKVPYNGDAADITKMIWQPWNIDLSTVNTNLESVRTLAIGVDDADAAGKLYIDDIRLYPEPPESTIPVEPNRANLIAYYAFDGDVTDSSGNGHHGELIGDPVYVAGVRGQALEFDGVDDHVQIADHDSLNPLEGSFTISFWAQLDPMQGTSGTGNWDIAVGKREAGSRGYYVGADRNQGTEDQAGFKFMLGNTSSRRVDTPYGLVSLGEWVFVTAVLDREQDVHKISVDGGHNWITATPPSGSVAPAQDLGIGFDIGPNNYWFHGAIDEVRFYNIALSDREVAWLAGN